MSKTLQLIDPTTGNWWKAYGGRSWTLIEGCTWPDGEMPPACEHCWARGMAQRFRPDQLSGVKVREDRLDLPLRTRAPTVFACQISYGDLFHPEVPVKFLGRVVDVLWHCEAIDKGHTFVLLTKRPEHAAKIFSEALWLYLHWESPDGEDGIIIPQNTILLASVWDQASTDAACTAFSRVPIRWGLHMEALLAETVLPWDNDAVEVCGQHHYQKCSRCPRFDCCDNTTPRPAWVVVGGETGPGARPMHPDWVRSIRDQCKTAGVPFWVKSMGGRNKNDIPDDLLVREVPW